MALICFKVLWSADKCISFSQNRLLQGSTPVLLQDKPIFLLIRSAVTAGKLAQHYR
jgi:hypothetical protein